MKRREAISGLVALGALTGLGAGVAMAAPYRIALFPDMVEPFRGMLSDAVRAQGWIEGREVVIENSGARHDSPNEQAAIAVVNSRPDLILTYSTNHALMLHRATRTIPIVMWTCGYPVEAGLADSLARPGKNVTGTSIYAGTGVWGKLLQLLKEIKPTTTRVGAYWTYVPPAYPKAEGEPALRDLWEASRALGIAVNIVEVEGTAQVPAALAALDAARPDALLLTSSPHVWDARLEVMRYAARRRLPTIVDFAWPADDRPYPLMTLGPRTPDLFRIAVSYVARIRGGAKPGELPIQMPSKFELLVNQATAKEIALPLPQSILVRADRVIE